MGSYRRHSSLMNVVLPEPFSPHHRQAAAHLELHVHVAQGPRLRVGIAEGHVPELNLIVAVRALLRGQAALVHGVGDVQKLVGSPQEHRVGAEVPPGGHQRAYVAGKGCDGADILGHAAHGKGPGPGLEAHKGVGKPCKHPGHRRGRRPRTGPWGPGRTGPRGRPGRRSYPAARSAG